MTLTKKESRCRSLWLAFGIPVGLLGMAGMGCAYPLYKRLTESERKRLAPEILRLTDELMQ